MFNYNDMRRLQSQPDDFWYGQSNFTFRRIKNAVNCTCKIIYTSEICDYDKNFEIVVCTKVDVKLRAKLVHQTTRNLHSFFLREAMSIAENIYSERLP